MLRFLAAVITMALGLCLAAAQIMATSERPVDNQLYNAMRAGDLGTVRRCLKKGANANLRIANGWPILLEAAQSANSAVKVSIARALIDAGADVNAIQPDQGWTPLHSAVTSMQASIEVIRLLVERGAKVNSQMPGLGTPLHGAVRFDRPEAVKYLLQRGADLEAHAIPVSNRTSDPSDMFDGLDDRVKSEVEKSIRASMEDSKRLIEESRREYENMTEAGYDQSGRTPLIEAAAQLSEQSTTMLVVLLDAGARIDAIDKVGRTALHEAAQAGNAEFIEFLIKRGAKVDTRTKNGLTPLHVACKPNVMFGANPAAVDALLRHGADPNARTNLGLSALELIDHDMKLIRITWEKRMIEFRDASQSASDDKESRRQIEAIEQNMNEIKGLLVKYGAGRSNGLQTKVAVVALLFLAAAVLFKWRSSRRAKLAASGQ